MSTIFWVHASSHVLLLAPPDSFNPLISPDQSGMHEMAGKLSNILP
jgi:hypothetical protein